MQSLARLAAAGRQQASTYRDRSVCKRWPNILQLSIALQPPMTARPHTLAAI